VKLEGDGQLLRIFIGESDHWKGRPLHEAILHLFKEAGLAGTTVLRGVEGFGASTRLHTTRLLQLSQDLPMIIEAVDTEEHIAAVLPQLDDMVAEGMVTLERVHVISYRGRAAT
jgi:PII-like signaling protein